ncbi:MAG TPA: galactose mutarotase [Calditrichaeota bacterium]|nr:galactose mutarotase [Calditrichota bacterium]
MENSNTTKMESIQTNLHAKDFKTIIDNKEVGLYWIENAQIKAAFTNYGGRLVGLWVLDKYGKYTDVVVGMNSADGFKNSTEPYFGATIGRVGNRIAKGKFTLNGKEYTIPVNNGANTLHGGIKGFQDVVWTANKINDETLVLTYSSPDGEQGFPGNLEVKVTYSVTSEQAMKMEYEATTDQPTVVNLTNHAFFNLNGEGSGTILNHLAQFNANLFTPVNSGLIPFGEHKEVKRTPFDFTEPHTIGERINAENDQLKNGAGYDHNFVLNETKKNGMNYVGSVTGDASGIVMDVYTEEPGFQFYSGNFMKGENTFKSGSTDDYRTAFALETQHFPDSPNHSNFPSITLNPKEKYHTISIYKFSIK